MSFLVILLFVIGLLALVVGSEALVRGASRIAAGLGISALVIGLTVVAFGTSSPELAVTLKASLAGQSDISLGNIVGSNIANILLVLGLTALATPVTVERQLIRSEIPVMIAASLYVYLSALDGLIGRIDGLVMVAGLVGYNYWAIRAAARERIRPDAEVIEAERDIRKHGRHWTVHVGMVLLGLGLLIMGSRWMVDGAVTFARHLKVDELIIGLTIVAVGTSLPEIATSLVAGLRGEQNLAVGNVIGSNILNILLVLGITALIAPAGIAVQPVALEFTIPVMVVVALACIPIFFSGYRVSRIEGGVFLGYYIAYIGHLVLDARGSTLLAAYDNLFIFFLFPFTALAIAFFFVRAWRRQKPIRRPPEHGKG